MVMFVNFNKQAVEDNKQIDNYIFIDTKTQILSGLTKVKILDKGYVTTKEFKKLTKTFTKYPTYNKSNEEKFHLKTI
jgi:hypothetical protein